MENQQSINKCSIFLSFISFGWQMFIQLVEKCEKCENTTLVVQIWETSLELDFPAELSPVYVQAN